MNKARHWHSCMSSYIHTYTLADLNAHWCIFVYIQTCLHAYIYTYLDSCIYIYILRESYMPNSHTDSHIDTHVCLQMFIHIHIHKHVYIYLIFLLETCVVLEWNISNIFALQFLEISGSSMLLEIQKCGNYETMVISSSLINNYLLLFSV